MDKTMNWKDEDVQELIMMLSSEEFVKDKFRTDPAFRVMFNLLHGLIKQKNYYKDVSDHMLHRNFENQRIIKDYDKGFEEIMGDLFSFRT
jgi:hypothetical protein